MKTNERYSKIIESRTQGYYRGIENIIYKIYNNKYNNLFILVFLYYIGR